MSATHSTVESPGAAGPSTRSAARARAGVAPPRKRVLVVDDDPVMRELIARVVLHVGDTPVHARSSKEALDLMAGEPVDLILTDLNMNGLGGLDLLAQLSTRPNSPPTLVITASDDPGELRAARLLGARRVIQKPISLAELRGAIGAALDDLLAAA